MNNLNFKDLVTLVEAVPQKAPAIVASNVKSVKPPTGGTFRTAAKTAFKGIGRGLKNAAYQAAFHPEETGNKLAGATGYEALEGLYKGAKGFKKGMQDQRQADLEKYNVQLTMPNGWPRKGAKVTVTTMYSGVYNGIVTNTQQLQDGIMVYTIVGTPVEQGKSGMVFVVTVNEKTRAFHSVQQWVASNITPDKKYIKNEKESGHKPGLEFNPETGIYEINSKERPAHDSIVGEPGAPVLKINDHITGVGYSSGENISGTVIGVKWSGGKNAQPGQPGAGIPIYSVVTTQ